MSCVQNIIKIASATSLISSVTMIGGGFILKKVEKSTAESNEKRALQNDKLPIFKKALYKTKQIMRDACGDDLGLFVCLGFAGFAGLSLLNEWNAINELSKLPEQEILKKLNKFF